MANAVYGVLYFEKTSKWSRIQGDHPATDQASSPLSADSAFDGLFLARSSVPPHSSEQKKVKIKLCI